MLPFPSLPGFEPALLRRSRRFRAALAVVLSVPLFSGALYVWANWNPTGNLNQVQAAVVNLDQPVTINQADGTEQTVPLGRTLAGELTRNDTPENFEWVLTDAADAQAGLTDGAYAAVVTIPENFSAAATSTGAEDGTEAEQALLRVRTNDAQNYLTGSITRNVADATTSALNTRLTRTYLDNVYVGFTDLNTQLGTAADGAQDLAVGADTLADGAVQADQGIEQLASGLGELATGSSQLPARTAELDRGARQLATGADRLADGAAELNSSLQPLRRALTELPSQTRQVATGARQVSTATGQLAEGADQLAGGAGQVATGAGALSAGVGELAEALAALAANCAAAGGAEAYCAQLAQAAGAAAPLQQGATELGRGAATLGDRVEEFGAGAQELATGAHELRRGTAALADGVPQLAAGIEQGAAAVGSLSTGARTLASGADQLAAGTGQLAAATPQLASGVSAAQRGADQAATGTGELADGAQELASGSDDLATGLADGVAQIPTYTQGERQTLSEVAATPVVDDLDRVNAVQGSGAGLAPYFIALGLWVGAMAVYLLLQALSVRALASTTSSWRVAVSGYLPGAVLVTVQALLLIAVLWLGVGVEAARLPALAAFAVLVALTFAAINQALIAAFGGIGRFLALILVSLQLSSAGGTYPIETAPAFFHVLHEVLPMTSAVDGLRAAIAGGAGLGDDIAPLLLWLVSGLLVTVVAAARQRTWSIARLHQAVVV